MITMKDYIALHKAQKQGLSISQIAAKQGKDRKTVRKYLGMDKDQFLRYLDLMAERGKAFELYKDEILEIFKNHEGKHVYASSIHDYLIEKYSILPGSERTLRNYLRYLKASGAIEASSTREYQTVEDLVYGKQAQIDFGVEQTNVGKSWFVTIILSKTRYRYAAQQARPFTIEDVIGHLLDSFEFFGGVFEELVLDQDRTMIVSENLGDIIKTKAFDAFVAEQGFKLWLCRASDPESKGKVENGVKYIKSNFFSSRSFDNYADIDKSMRRWLCRANLRISQATRFIAKDDFEANEKPLLKPIRASIFRPSAGSTCQQKRKADQCSLISIEATRYSVPSEYRLKEVSFEQKDGLIFIYNSITGSQIAVHQKALVPGGKVIDRNHFRNREASVEILKNKLIGEFSDLPEWVAFIDSIYKEYRRYFRDHALRLLKFIETKPDKSRLSLALVFCLDNGLANAQNLLDAPVWHDGLANLNKPQEQKQTCFQPKPLLYKTELPLVQTRSLSVYQAVFDKVISQDGGLI